MSERLDILVPTKRTEAAAHLYNFVVDNAAVTGMVGVNLPAGPPADFGYLYNCENSYIFSKGDNFIVNTFGLIMPLSFQLDRSTVTTNPLLFFSLIAHGVTTGKLYYLKELGATASSSASYGVMENYDTPLDIFVDVQNQALVTGSNLKDERFYLTLTIGYDISVSMIGVPDSLNGTTQLLTPYVKLLHTFPLAAV